MQYRPIRQSQLISPFGIGAMVDFRNDESLMVAGLDSWPKAKEKCPEDWLVREERLEARMGMSHFRIPPDYRTDRDDPLAYQSVPFVRFPRWHYCPKCGHMEKISIYGGRVRCPGKIGMCQGLPEKRRLYLIPVRIVAVCPQGHIEDFPFMKWVHHGTNPEGGGHSLQFLASRSSASLGGIKIKCNCGKYRSLAGAFEYSEKGSALHRIGHDCAGNSPWLGESGGQPDNNCGQMLRVVQRGASNVYFPVVASSIYLPLWADREDKAVISVLESTKYWEMISSGLDGNKIDKSRIDLIAQMTGVDLDKLYDAAQKKLDGGTPGAVETDSEEQFRFQEYSALREGRGRSETELLVDIVEGREYSGLENIIERVCLVRKLRETRIFAGFTRLLPAESSEISNVQKLCLDDEIRWRPASVVRGEGIFVELRSQALDSWRETPGIEDRINGLSNYYNETRKQRGMFQLLVNPHFVMIHTFAHALIGQLSFACGYGSASLRERIYCNIETDNEMNGFLIYTASGDSEGTLGGLVRQGEPSRLPSIIFDALNKVAWCSSDPVCIESSGQGIDNANLAACHGCVLLPETSCEQGNRLLDRGVLVGTPDNPGLGFFSRK